MAELSQNYKAVPSWNISFSRSVRGELSHRDLFGNFAELKHRWDSGKRLLIAPGSLRGTLRVDLMTRGSFAETKNPAAADGPGVYDLGLEARAFCSVSAV